MKIDPPLTTIVGNRYCFSPTTNAKKQLIADNEKHSGTVNDISENTTETKGTYIEDIFTEITNSSTFERLE